MAEQDEPPLLNFVRSSGGTLIRIFSPVWPPTPLAGPPRTCGEDECLAIWYPEIISSHELLLPDCQPEKGPRACYNAWELPFVTVQRQWYWKKQATIFAVELDYRSFRPNRPEDAEFPADEIADFERRLTLLRSRVGDIRTWCTGHLWSLTPDCFAAEGAWEASDDLRRYECRRATPGT